MFFTVVFKTTGYFSTFDVFRKCRCNIYCHVALQLMLLCFSCKQGWVPVPGIKLWKLIDLINNSHKRHNAHMRIHIHMHETQFTCTKKYIYIHKNQFTCTKRKKKSQKPIHVHKIRIYIHKIRFTNAKHNSQMYNCVQNFECLKFTSVSWTVNVQNVFRV